MTWKQVDACPSSVSLLSLRESSWESCWLSGFETRATEPRQRLLQDAWIRILDRKRTNDTKTKIYNDCRNNEDIRGTSDPPNDGKIPLCN